MQVLIHWDIPPYLRKLLQSYFNDRVAVATCLAAPEGKLLVAVSCGVPQGLVVGPLLWNMTYDQVLRVSLPSGVSVIGFADDILVIVQGKTCAAVEDQMNTALNSISNKISTLNLTLAVEKTEAVMFRRKYKDDTPFIALNGALVSMKRSIKYLGIVIDYNLNFNQHVEATAAKAERTLTALSRLMPNVGEPKESLRKLLVSVIHSVILYGAPV